METNLRLIEFIKFNLKPFELALLFKNIFYRKRVECHINNDLKFFVDPLSDFGYRLIKQKSYEPDTTEIIKQSLKTGDTFVDLGANEGFYSVIASKIVGPTGRILSVEPQQRLWFILTKNFELNKCTNCILIPYGVDTKEGEVVFHLSPSLNSGQTSLVEGQSFLVSRSLGRRIRQLYFEKQKVNLITLDELFRLYNLTTIDLIKIDVEGFEYNALLSAQGILRARKVKRIYVEFHPEHLKKLNQKVEDIYTFLNEVGYHESNVSGLFLLK